MKNKGNALAILLLASLFVIPAVPQASGGQWLTTYYYCIEFTYYRAYKGDNIGDGDGLTGEVFFKSKMISKSDVDRDFGWVSSDGLQDVNPPSGFWVDDNDYNDGSPANGDGFCGYNEDHTLSASYYVPTDYASNYDLEFHMRFFDDDGISSGDDEFTYHIYWTNLPSPDEGYTLSYHNDIVDGDGYMSWKLSIVNSETQYFA